jgi:hypothetical protein
MSYINGIIVTTNVPANLANVYGDKKIPTFFPPAGFTYSNIYTSLIAPSVSAPSSGGRVLSLYGMQIAPSINATA